MPILKRGLPLVGLAAFAVFLFYVQYTSHRTEWRDVSQVVGLGELVEEPTSTAASYTAEHTGSESLGWDPMPSFVTGTAKPPGSNYTRTLVMSRIEEDNIDWVYGGLPDIEKAIYVADDLDAPLHPPVKKGHEGMV